MAKIQPFTFERAFDREGKGPLAPRPAQRKTLTVEEIEALKRDAYAEGARAAEAGQAKRIGDALVVLVTRIDQLGASLAEAVVPARMESVRLAYVMALTLCRELMTSRPEAEIEALLARCIDEHKSEPHLVLRVNDALHDTMRAVAKELAAARGFGGRIHIIGEPEIPVGNCTIEWADGGLERNLGQALSEVEHVIRSYIAAGGGNPDTVPAKDIIFSVPGSTDDKNGGA